MNEKEIKECDELYEIEKVFEELADKIFEEFKPEMMLCLTKLWLKLDEMGVTHEALRYPITASCLNTMAIRIEYDAVLMSEQLRDIFLEDNSLSQSKKTEGE